MPPRFVLLFTCALPLLFACGAAQTGSEGPKSIGNSEPSGETPPELVETAPSQGKSLLMEDLPPTLLPSGQAAAFTQKLAEAQQRLQAEPESLDAWIWVGRRLGYLGRMSEAIEHYSEALEKFPKEPRLLRHRGHRYLSIRDLDHALLDFSTAAELLEGKEDRIEEDGLPNAEGKPRSTLKGNVWYHLGLTHFVRGEYSRAYSAFAEAQGIATNDDARISSMYWCALSLMRIELYTDMATVLAGLPREPDVIENHDYLSLVRLFRQEADPTELLEGKTGLQLATLGFGVAQYHLGRAEIDPEAAKLSESVDPNEVYLKILDGSPWSAFGHIAAEAELSRL